MRPVLSRIVDFLNRWKRPLLSALFVMAIAAATRAYDFAGVATGLARDNGLVVEAVTIEGAEKTARSAVLSASGITLGGDILAFDVKTVRTHIENLPWIKLAHVVRILPGSIEIDVVERKPYALWQMAGAIWLIDDTGTPIIETDPALYTALPLLVGEGAPGAVADFAEILKATPDLEKRITSLIRVSERRWDLILDSGVRLKLPESDGSYGPESAWRRFAAMEGKYRLLKREVSILDFRFPDRLVVRLTPAGKRALEKTGRTT